MPKILRAARRIFLVSGALFIAGCVFDGDGEDPVVPVFSDGGYSPVEPRLPSGWPSIRWPSDNRYSSAKAILGRRLFFEKALSRDSSVSCGACHKPAEAFADAGVVRSGGAHGLFARRNSPTLTNVAIGTSFMSEGGVPTLELQALAPLLAENEMDMTGPEIESRLSADTLYVRLFRQAYGDVPVTLAGVTKALATYERTLVSFRSPYDRWQSGEDGAISESAKRGAAIFLGEKGDCWHCHSPPAFTDRSFHDIGLDSAPADVGRYLVTGLAADAGKFKTPTLRNVGATGPYMHDGRFATLREVVEHYNSGGRPDPNRSPLVRPMGLSASEIDDLVSFLESLTDSTFLAQTAPGSAP